MRTCNAICLTCGEEIQVQVIGDRIPEWMECPTCQQPFAPRQAYSMTQLFHVGHYDKQPTVQPFMIVDPARALTLLTNHYPERTPLL